MYRGRWGMLAWALHRISGLGVLLFLILHIADTALILAGPTWYNRFVAFYRVPVFRVMEVLLAAALLYHALNGLRIIALDLWPQTTRIHERLFWVAGAIFVILFVPAAYFMLRPLWT
ncbi:MAG: succinate dehydrogenase, cytochrome b556 subunit [Firmicutes bacterium]|nr:succinate dehydrogenase, cytochrome b556 subunit [Bacillota bacterium]